MRARGRKLSDVSVRVQRRYVRVGKERGAKREMWDASQHTSCTLHPHTHTFRNIKYILSLSFDVQTRTHMQTYVHRGERNGVENGVAYIQYGCYMDSRGVVIFTLLNFVTRFVHESIQLRLRTYKRFFDGFRECQCGIFAWRITNTDWNQCWKIKWYWGFDSHPRMKTSSRFIRM